MEFRLHVGWLLDLCFFSKGLQGSVIELGVVLHVLPNVQLGLHDKAIQLLPTDPRFCSCNFKGKSKNRGVPHLPKIICVSSYVSHHLHKGESMGENHNNHFATDRRNKCMQELLYQISKNNSTTFLANIF